MKRLFYLVLIPLIALFVSCSTASRENALPGLVSTALDKAVSLAAPYPKAYPNAPTDKISVQYAVREIGKQVGLRYDSKQSTMNAGDVLKKWITPDIRGIPCREALQQILEPHGLTYKLRGKQVIVTRKP